MIEIDSQHTPYEVTDLDPGTLLGLLSEDRVTELKVNRKKLRLAYQWCVLNPPTPDTDPACWADAQLPSFDDESFAGDGSPGIAAFAAEDYAATMGLSRHAALCLLADTLDLHHRLPRLWACVEDLHVPGWKARRIAEITRPLSAEAAEWFDEELDTRGLYGWPTIDRTLAMAIAKFHPELMRDKNGPLSKADWDVKLFHRQGAPGTASGTSRLEATGDSMDLTRFADLVAEEAEKLRRAGDADTLGQRKAKALGVIADRDQGTLDYDPADEGHSTTKPAINRKGRRGLRVMVHVSLTDLLNLAGSTCDGDLSLADTDRFGPVLVQQLRDWLANHGSIASITPVVDMNRTDAVEQHDPPEWMANLVRLRDPQCVFPHCTTSSWDSDLDHITPYDATGPPGQTCSDNLAPCCRRHHALKTHGRWRYQRLPDGAYLWGNGYGRTWLVRNGATTEITGLI